MQPPYLGPKVEEGNGRRFLVGYEFVNKGEPVVVCEGTFDALRLWQAGLKPLALLGKGLGRTQLVRLVKLAPRHVTVMLDSDAWIDARRIAADIGAFIRDVRVVMLDEGDPDDHDERELVRLVENAESAERADRRRIRDKLASLRY
jgi:DNA primase